MKRIFTLALLLCFVSLGLTAQNHRNIPRPHNYIGLWPFEQLEKNTPANNKSMALNSRLKAYRYDDYDNGNWVFEDSSSYQYSGTRGGNYFDEYGPDSDVENGYTWDGSAWNNSNLVEKTFNTNNQMLSYTSQFWNNGAWLGYQREFFTYNANGFTATHINEYWDWDSTAWIADKKHIYTYDANGKVLVDEEQEWSDINIAWNPYTKVTNTYNVSGQQLTQLQQERAGGSYFDRYRTTWKYTAGNLDTVLNEEYVTPANVWEFRRRSYYTYNAANQVLTQTNERFYNAIWNGDERYTSTYNGQGHKTSETIEIFGGGAYENDTKIELTVDGNGRNTESFYYVWDGSAWANESKYVYGYDAAGNENFNNYFSWKSGAWQENFLELSTFNSYNQLVSDSVLRDFFDGIVVPNYRAYYYYEEYEDGSNGINSIPTLPSTVLPNPFTINVAIQVNATVSGAHTFEVYNMAGQRIHSESRHLTPGQQTIVWDGGDAPKGVYFYKINSQSGVASGKLVKQ